MNRRARLVIGLAVALVGTTIPVAIVSAQGGGTGHAHHTSAAVPAEQPDESLEQVRDATRRFRDVGRAIDDGYVQFFGCVHEPLAGSMGIHFVNGALATDAVIDAATPEALIYEVKPNGQLALVGAEYVVFQAAWDAANPEPPSLFGQPFTLVPKPNRYGLEPFYELHTWAWKSNPAGAFNDWNPQVICATTEGHTH
jgi:hypothetical protein